MAIINNIAQAVSFLLLIGGTFTFGLLGQPAEMGLCIVAAAIGLGFTNLEKVESFKGGGVEVRVLKRQVEAIVAKETEPTPKADTPSLEISAYGMDEATRRVLVALGSTKYTWRTFGGIAKESGASLSSVQKALDWLALNDLAVRMDTNRKAQWALSDEGRNVYNSIAT